MLIDTHCHLFYKDLKHDISNVLTRAKELGVDRFICVGTNMEDSKECLGLAEIYDPIYASAGIHPHDAKDAPEDFQDQILDLMTFDKMIAVGEIGLDYYRNISHRSIQKRVFRGQMKLAQQLQKPVIIHNRDADKDVIKILSEYSDVIGVAHCFSSNLETAKIFLDFGYYISFAGNLTFKNSHLPEVAKNLPINRILIETDSPYLSPAPHRGKPNEPGRTRFVAEKLANLFNLSVEELAEITTTNAENLFNF